MSKNKSNKYRSEEDELNLLHTNAFGSNTSTVREDIHVGASGDFDNESKTKSNSASLQTVLSNRQSSITQNDIDHHLIGDPHTQAFSNLNFADVYKTAETTSIHQPSLMPLVKGNGSRRIIAFEKETPPSSSPALSSTFLEVPRVDSDVYLGSSINFSTQQQGFYKIENQELVKKGSSCSWSANLSQQGHACGNFRELRCNSSQFGVNTRQGYFFGQQEYNFGQQGYVFGQQNCSFNQTNFDQQRNLEQQCDFVQHNSDQQSDFHQQCNVGAECYFEQQSNVHQQNNFDQPSNADQNSHIDQQSIIYQQHGIYDQDCNFVQEDVVREVVSAKTITNEVTPRMLAVPPKKSRLQVDIQDTATLIDPPPNFFRTISTQFVSSDFEDPFRVPPPFKFNTTENNTVFSDGMLKDANKDDLFNNDSFTEIPSTLNINKDLRELTIEEMDECSKSTLNSESRTSESNTTDKSVDKNSVKTLHKLQQEILDEQIKSGEIKDCKCKGDHNTEKCISNRNLVKDNSNSSFSKSSNCDICAKNINGKGDIKCKCDRRCRDDKFKEETNYVDHSYLKGDTSFEAMKRGVDFKESTNLNDPNLKMDSIFRECQCKEGIIYKMNNLNLSTVVNEVISVGENYINMDQNCVKCVEHVASQHDLSKVTLLNEVVSHQGLVNETIQLQKETITQDAILNRHTPHMHLPHVYLPNKVIPKIELPNEPLPNVVLSNKIEPNKPFSGVDLQKIPLPNVQYTPVPNEDLPNMQPPKMEIPKCTFEAKPCNDKQRLESSAQSSDTIKEIHINRALQQGWIESENRDNTSVSTVDDFLNRDYSNSHDFLNTCQNSSIEVERYRSGSHRQMDLDRKRNLLVQMPHSKSANVTSQNKNDIKFTSDSLIGKKRHSALNYSSEHSSRRKVGKDMDRNIWSGSSNRSTACQNSCSKNASSNDLSSLVLGLNLPSSIDGDTTMLDSPLEPNIVVLDADKKKPKKKRRKQSIRFEDIMSSRSKLVLDKYYSKTPDVTSNSTATYVVSPALTEQEMSPEHFQSKSSEISSRMTDKSSPKSDVSSAASSDYVLERNKFNEGRKYEICKRSESKLAEFNTLNNDKDKESQRYERGRRTEENKIKRSYKRIERTESSERTGRRKRKESNYNSKEIERIRNDDSKKGDINKITMSKSNNNMKQMRNDLLEAADSESHKSLEHKSSSSSTKREILRLKTLNQTNPEVSNLMNEIITDDFKTYISNTSAKNESSNLRKETRIDDRTSHDSFKEVGSTLLSAQKKVIIKPTKKALKAAHEFINTPSHPSIRLRTQEEESIRNKFFTHRQPQHVDMSYYSLSSMDDIQEPEEEMEEEINEKETKPTSKMSKFLGFFCMRNKKQEEAPRPKWFSDKPKKMYRHKQHKPLEDDPSARELNTEFCDISNIPTTSFATNDKQLHLQPGEALRPYMHNVMERTFKDSIAAEKRPKRGRKIKPKIGKDVDKLKYFDVKDVDGSKGVDKIKYVDTIEDVDTSKDVEMFKEATYDTYSGSSSSNLPMKPAKKKTPVRKSRKKAKILKNKKRMLKTASQSERERESK